jgi:hypothetical protein
LQGDDGGLEYVSVSDADDHQDQDITVDWDSAVEKTGKSGADG